MGVMSDDYDREHWPFRAKYYPDIGWVYYIGAEERIEAVRRMSDSVQLRAALDVPGVQQTVARAIRRRLRELGLE